jgi:predicted permease
VINAVLLKPLPYRQPQQLVRIFETFLPSGWGTVSLPNFQDWRQQNHVFDHLEAFSTGSMNLQGDANPERIPSVVATAGLFDMLGAQPMLGRTFLPDEDQPGKPEVAVISERLWKRRFAGDPNLLGSNINLDGKPTTVVGIMPASFEFPPANPERTLWVPLQLAGAPSLNRGSHWMNVVGRLKPGQSLGSAVADMKPIAARIAEQFPGEQKGRSIMIRSLQDVLVGNIRPALLVLMGSVGFVLLIACANVANLLLARAASRKREVAVRAALGANRGRLIRQFLTESIMLALAGGVVGAFLADLGVQALVVLASQQIPRAAEVHVDGTVFLFLLGVCLLCGIIFGLVPAFQSTGRDAQGLKEGGRSGGVGGHSEGYRNALVIAEFALALVLLIGAGLLLRSFVVLNSVDSGVKAGGVLIMSVSLPQGKYPNGSMWQRFYEPALERIQALPGVRAVGMIKLLPLQNWGTNGDFVIEGRPPAEPGQRPFAESRDVSPGYFRAMGIPIVRGRGISAEDSATSLPVVMINDALARKYFKGEDPIGQKIQWDSLRTIVGVAGSIHQAGLDRAPLPELYFPAAQRPGSIAGMTLVISSNVEPTSLTRSIESAIHSVDPSQPVFGVKTMQRVVSESLSSQRLYVWLLGVFAAIALILASAGIYGVMSYLVTRRTQEFGVRMALGASTRDILRMVLRQSLMLIAVGVAIGLAGAVAVTRVLTNFLFGVKPTDLATFAAVSMVLVIVALIATYLPALRATKVDPMVALRYE